MFSGKNVSAGVLTSRIAMNIKLSSTTSHLNAIIDMNSSNSWLMSYLTVHRNLRESLRSHFNHFGLLRTPDIQASFLTRLQTEWCFIGSPSFNFIPGNFGFLDFLKREGGFVKLGMHMKKSLQRYPKRGVLAFVGWYLGSKGTTRCTFHYFVVYVP